MTSRVVAATSTGLVRKRNEDSAYVGRWLCAIADGMGGHAAGDVASTTVIDTVQRCDLYVPDTTQLTKVLGAAVRDANIEIAARVREDPELGNMGSTLTAMLWSGNHMALANVGDSRAYLLRDGILRRITDDHVLSRLVARPMPLEIGEYLVRFLDARPGVSPDLTLRTVRPGDRYLLCSDGLSSVISASVIRDVLADADLDDVATALIRQAHEAGAPDNITVIVADLPDGIWQPESAEPQALGAAAAAAR